VADLVSKNVIVIFDMQAINRFLYGPTPEERVRAWQSKLRAEQRILDREMRQVGNRNSLTMLDIKFSISVRLGD
jgi:hypothetical protein